MDKLVLTNIEDKAGRELRLICYFLFKMNTLLIQGIVQKRIVNMNGDKAGDAIVIRGNAEVEQIYIFTSPRLASYTFVLFPLPCRLKALV